MKGSSSEKYKNEEMNSTRNQATVEECNLCHAELGPIDEGHKGNHWSHVAAKHIQIVDSEGKDFTNHYTALVKGTFVRANTAKFTDPKNLVCLVEKKKKRNVIVVSFEEFKGGLSKINEKKQKSPNIQLKTVGKQGSVQQTFENLLKIDLKPSTATSSSNDFGPIFANQDLRRPTRHYKRSMEFQTIEIEPLAKKLRSLQVFFFFFKFFVFFTEYCKFTETQSDGDDLGMVSVDENTAIPISRGLIHFF